MKPEDQKLKILIADDHDVVRDGIKAVLQNHFDNAEIIEAVDGDEALVAADNNPDFDLFLIDYYMPKQHGLVLLTKLKEKYPDIPVIFISSAEEYELMKSTIDKGASGFIPKTTSPKIIVQAVSLVIAGGTYIPKAMLDTSDNREATHDFIPSEPSAERPDFTKRQITILNLIAHGSTDKEIADELNITLNTVKSHTATLRTSLNAHNRTMAVENARKLGLIK